MQMVLFQSENLLPIQTAIPTGSFGEMVNIQRFELRKSGYTRKITVFSLSFKSLK